MSLDTQPGGGLFDEIATGITDEGEWAEFLDKLFADQQASTRGGALPTASRREREEMDVPR